MPTLYPYITRKHVNYDKNNVSRVPVRVKEDPKEFLYSKSYYKTLNNKVMNIPILIKEQPLKASPEKKEYWNLSDTRRRQLEDLRFKEVLLAKTNRLTFYINHKFVTKFGSRHKKGITAVVENFLSRKETTNIDSDDLYELDTLISDLISRKKENKFLLKAVTTANITDNIFSNTNSIKDSNSQKLLSQSMGQLSGGRETIFTPLQFHRSLTIEERLKSEILFKKANVLRQKNFLEEQIKIERERQKLKEIENYKYKQYIDQNFESFNLEEIQRQKDTRLKQIENKKYYDEQIRERNLRLQKEKEAAILDEEKNALIIEKNYIERQRKAFEAKQIAVSYKEKVQTEQNVLENDLKISRAITEYNSNITDDKRSCFAERGNANGTIRNKVQTENKGSFEMFDSRRNTDETERNIDNGGLINFKLSQKTFKKIVTDKQHEQNILNSQIEGRNAALKNIVFDNSDLLSSSKSNVFHKKGSHKILDSASVPRKHEINYNRSFFVNRDIEKFSQSSRSAIL